MTKSQSQYELFQEWLNDCPVKVLDYQDFTDQFQITFGVELEEEKVIITPQELEGDISTVTDDDYGDKVDTLVDNMVASNDKEFTHDSEGC